MAVTVTITFTVDPTKFEALTKERAADFEAVAADGKSSGALSHRFVAGDGTVMVIDEWESVEAFQAFFANQPIIASLLEAAGVQEPPVVAVYQSLTTPDAF